jgi:hypothetical protein
MKIRQFFFNFFKTQNDEVAIVPIENWLAITEENTRMRKEIAEARAVIDKFKNPDEKRNES